MSKKPEDAEVTTPATDSSEGKGASGNKPASGGKSTSENKSTLENKSKSKRVEAPASNKDKNRPVKTTKPPRFSLFLALLALLISILALVASIYLGWRGKPLEDNQPALVSGQEQLQSQIARQQARLTETIQAFPPIKQNLQEQQQRSERLLGRVDMLSRQLKELSGSNRDGWKLAEVEYLLRLANQKLLMTADVISAKALLRDADNILVGLDDYTLYPVREALAEDMAVLRSVSDIDQEGIYLRLSALTRQVDELPILEPERHKHQAKTIKRSSPSTETEADEGGWQRIALDMLQNTWNSFTTLFRFTTNREQPLAPLMTAEENALVRQNLRLLIEQGKLALLAREQRIYNESLLQAQKWIEQYFIMAGSASIGMIDELQTLSSVTVNPVLPNISRALDMLKQYQSSEPATTAPLKAPASAPAPATTPKEEQEESSVEEPQGNGEEQSS